MTELRRDALLPLVVLVTLLVLLSAGTVALLARIAPAIERIIADNLYSLEAAEDMMVAVCNADAPDAEEVFSAGLARAEGNITEKSETGLLATLRARGPEALAGDAEARGEALAALQSLAGINREAVVREDENAQRLGYASAWAGVLLGVLAFAWALIAVQRTRRRVVEPLQEIASVIDAVHAGDHYRRCRPAEASREITRIMDGVNELLDARSLLAIAQQPSFRESVDRQILLHLLEERAAPAWVVTPEGSIDAASASGLERLAGSDGDTLRRALTDAASGKEVSELSVARIAGADRLLCELTG